MESENLPFVTPHPRRKSSETGVRCYLSGRHQVPGGLGTLAPITGHPITDALPLESTESVSSSATKCKSEQDVGKQDGLRFLNHVMMPVKFLGNKIPSYGFSSIYFFSSFLFDGSFQKGGGTLKIKINTFFSLQPWESPASLYALQEGSFNFWLFVCTWPQLQSVLWLFNSYLIIKMLLYLWNFNFHQSELKLEEYSSLLCSSSVSML